MAAIDRDAGSRLRHPPLIGIGIDTAMDRHTGVLRNRLRRSGYGTDESGDDKHRNRSSKLDSLHCRVSLSLDLPGFRPVVDSRADLDGAGHTAQQIQP